MFTTVAPIVDLLGEYQLIDSDALAQRLERLGPQVTPESLLADLVRLGLLTQFQSDQLINGNARRLVLGGYRLLEPLGEGGMGQVYKASQIRLNRKVAIKVIAPHLIGDEQAFKRFQREAEAAARLTHPNIVVIHDFDCDGSIWYLVMEYVEGTDLAGLVKQRGMLGIREACIYIQQTAEGLQHAHDAGLIHRDIKPHNLLLTWPKEAVTKRSSGSISMSSLLRTVGEKNRASQSHENAIIKILDLGLARIQGPESEDSMSRLTRTNALLGTPDYISPEQSREAHSVDGRADIYSLGCTMYYLLAGAPPFADRSVVDKLVAHQTETAVPIEEYRPQISHVLGDIVRKMMAKRPDQRFRTAREVARALDDYLHGSPTPSSEISPTPRSDSSDESCKTVIQRVPTVRMKESAEESTPSADHPTQETQFAPESVSEKEPEFPRPLPQRIAVLSGHRGPITGLAFSSDGRLLATCGTDDTVRIWSLANTNPIEIAVGSGPPFRAMQSLAFSPGMLQLAIGSSEASGRIILWNWGQSTSRNVTTIQVDPMAVESLAYAPDGGMLAAAVGPTIWVWRVKDADVKLRTALKGHRGNVKSIAFAQQEGILASGGDDGTLRLWQLGRLWAGEKNATIASRDPIQTIAWSPHGIFLAAGGLDQKVRIWDTQSGPTESTRTVGRVDGYVRRIDWTPDGAGLFALGDRGQLTGWERLSESQNQTVWNLDPGLLNATALHGRGLTALGCTDGTVHLFAVEWGSLSQNSTT